MATRTATDRSTATVTRTGDRTRTDALADLVATVSEQIGFPTIDPVSVDGRFLTDEDGVFRKVWTRATGEDYEERIVARSPSLLAGWHVYHQTPDGREHCVTDDRLEREAAFEEAERLAADIESVPIECRTGRAS
ncbi:hypothetical protein [Natronosalvus rutilus]|uniref:Uncharacterized protein n=1 Tax=Natronosalvus rutilus TaxID=2953753 RepID=A0A9E7SV84_9EURY|nr:hypothetical protein [Natronosalvus rutilus]UTF52751.1 hypothetical protein NGM29_13290 [Natronosalvus rutilus]